MEQFQAFVQECISNEATDNKVLRNDIYDYYSSWRGREENLIGGKPYIMENGEYARESNGELFIIERVCKYGKIIGRPKFYELLISEFGEPPIINNKTKQYKYFLKFK